MANEEKFKVAETEQTKIRKVINFKYKKDEEEFKKLSDKHKSIVLGFILQNKLRDGDSSRFYITKKQRIVVEEILKELYLNGNQLLSKLKPIIIKNIDKRCRDIGLKYDNKVNKILESNDKYILVKKNFGGKNYRFFDGKNIIEKILFKMRPQFLSIAQYRKFDKGKFFSYTGIRIASLGSFLGRLLAKEELEIREKEIVNVEIKNEFTTKT